MRQFRIPAVFMRGGTSKAIVFQDAPLLERLAAIRIAASLAMGIASTAEEARRRAMVPFVGFVSPPGDANADLTGRVISNGQPHRALPLTASLCMAVAARLPGSVVFEALRHSVDAESEIRIAMPSGELTVAATVGKRQGEWYAEQGTFFRTQRRLFEGHVLVRASRVPRMA